MKVTEICQSVECCRVISKALGLQQTTLRAIMHKWNSGELSKWPADKNDPKGAVTTHPRRRKRPHNNTQRAAGFICLS